MTFLNWFEARPDVRLAAGLAFLIALAWVYFRRSQGTGRWLFSLLALFSSAIFALSPLAHLLAFAALLVVAAAGEIRRAGRETPYEPAVAMVESGGIKRGLTAAEAAVIMEGTVGTVVATVMLGLLRKRFLEPAGGVALAFELAPAYQTGGAGPDPAAHRRAAQAANTLLHPFEEPFLALFEGANGRPLDSVNATAAVRALLRHTARRVRGHSVPETRTYYQKHLGRARHDVELAGQAGPADRAFDRNFDWLFLDREYAGLYAEYLNGWLADRGLSGEEPRSWLEKLLAAASATVPAGALSFRTGEGRQLALGGNDSLTAEHFEAVIAGTR